MAGKPLPFPVSALPGRLPGEGQGDLLNVYATKEGEEIRHYRVAGLSRFSGGAEGPTSRNARGQLAVDNYLLTAWTDELEAVSPNGVVTALGGEAVVGSRPVTMARNLRQIPQIAIVSENAAYLASLDTMTVEPYPLTPLQGGGTADNLGGVNSVDYYSGYFIFSRADGTIVASNLQNATIPDLSFDEAKFSADGLLRVKSYGETVLLMGQNTIEVWADVGKKPFPLARQNVITTGMLGPWCVAGGPNVWERGVLFIASDFTVRQLNGYDPVIVSTPAVSRDIYAAREIVDQLQCQVYTFDEQAIFSITGPTWSWEFNLSTGAWHRRSSLGQKVWRGRFAQQFRNRWYVQDALHDGLLEVTPDAPDEAGERIHCMCESAALRDFPVSVRVPSVNFDFTVGIGRFDRPANEHNPAVLISWSHDGGASWSNPVARSLGGPGEVNRLVSVRNLGRSTHQGLRLRWEISDPVPITFRGAIAPTLAPSRARQVAAG